jgi:AmmeMemoRadiSam system protein A
MENPDLLTPEQGQTLVRLARQALEQAIRHAPVPAGAPPLDPRLKEPGATFVTLTIRGALRGCIGSPQAHLPLAEDVQENAIRSATGDPRFPPVTARELDSIDIEVSVLTPPRPLDCPPVERPQRVRPGVDGLLLVSNYARGLLLPQVWEKIPDPVDFLEILSQKAGLSRRAWLRSETELLTFQVQAFHEETH